MCDIARVPVQVQRHPVRVRALDEPGMQSHAIARFNPDIGSVALVL